MSTDYDLRGIKQSRERIAQVRKIMAFRAEKVGNDALTMRRILGMPDPDEKEWADRMLKFQMGLAALLIQWREYKNVHVPPLTREWLRHPVTDQLPSDRRLMRLLQAVDPVERREPPPSSAYTTCYPKYHH